MEETHHARRLQVLGVLADAHDFPGGGKVLLHGLPRRDGGDGVALAHQVPAQKARQVLERPQRLVAADGGGDKAQVVGDGRVMGEGVDDHC